MPLSQTQEFSEQGPVVVVLDALDECGSAKTRKVLLDLLAQEHRKLPSNIRIIITSRAEHDIQKFLGSQTNVAIRELELAGSANMKDIELYLRYWMTIIRKITSFYLCRQTGLGRGGSSTFLADYPVCSCGHPQRSYSSKMDTTPKNDFVPS